MRTILPFSRPTMYDGGTCDFYFVNFFVNPLSLGYSFLLINARGNMLYSFSDISSKDLSFLFVSFLDVCWSFVKPDRVVLFLSFGLPKEVLNPLLVYLGSKKNFRVTTVFRSGTFYELIIRYGSKTIVFRDVLLLLPCSLPVFISLYIPVRDSVVVSLESDFCTFVKAFTFYYTYIRISFGVDLLCFLTLSTFSFSLYKYFYYPCNIRIQSLSGNLLRYVRSSYLGGFSSVLSDYPCLYKLDINSLYPYIMSMNPLPTTRIKYHTSFLSSFDLSSFFGFIRVKAIAPSDLLLPFLHFPMSTSSSSCLEGTFFSEELKYALALGYKLEYLDGVEFDRSYLFRPFVSDLYDQRLVNNLLPLNKLLKTLLNTLYGRFGMVNDVSKSVLLKKSDVASLSSVFSVFNVTSMDTISSYFLVQYSSVASLPISSTSDSIFDSFSPDNVGVQVASAVTAYARMELYSLVVKLNASSFDTDSVKLDIKAPVSLFSSKKLGGLKYVLRKD